MNKRLHSLFAGVLLSLPLIEVHAGGQTIPVAYHNIGSTVGVPPKILYAIALAESRLLIGKDDVKPWPWTINVRGKPQRFRNSEQTRLAVEAALDAGITNIDVGLMQVNMHYHQQRFDSTGQAVQPYQNIRVGATILKEAYRQCKQDWWCAVGRYHSRKQHHARRYTRTVRSLWLQLD